MECASLNWLHGGEGGVGKNAYSLPVFLPSKYGLLFILRVTFFNSEHIKTLLTNQKQEFFLHSEYVLA